MITNTNRFVPSSTDLVKAVDKVVSKILSTQPRSWEQGWNSKDLSHNRFHGFL